jgi:hypothetical protein
MPRSFAVNHKCFPMAAEVVTSLVLVGLMGLTFSTRLQAQGPALTTISGTVSTSPTTIAAVLTTPGTGLGNLAATQQDVDAAVANVGTGSFVSKAGDTLTDPLTLPAETPLV